MRRPASACSSGCAPNRSTGSRAAKRAAAYAAWGLVLGLGLALAVASRPALPQTTTMAERRGLPVRLVLDAAAAATAAGQTEEARRLLTPLAKAGSAEAMLALGGLIEAAGDLFTAYVWYAVATERGLIAARPARNRLAAVLPVEQIVAGWETVASFRPEPLPPAALQALLTGATPVPAPVPPIEPAATTAQVAPAVPAAPVTPAMQVAPAIQIAPAQRALSGRFIVLEPANLRSGPSAEAARIDRLAAGAEVEATGETGGWLRIRRSDGSEGWVARKLVADPEAAALLAASRRDSANQAGSNTVPQPGPGAGTLPSTLPGTPSAGTAPPPPPLAPSLSTAGAAPASMGSDTALVAELMRVGSVPADPRLLERLTGRWARDCTFPGGEIWRAVGPSEMEWQVLTQAGPLSRRYAVAGSPEAALLVLRDGNVIIARRVQVAVDSLVILEILALEDGRLVSREAANYTFRRCA